MSLQFWGTRSKMPTTPSEIVDSLESLLDIFLSDIRHRERTVFILCDNLVEMACKTKAKSHNHRFDTSCNFYDAWNAPGVRLPRNGLGERVQLRRETRNTMQHENPAVTVDTQVCADAIKDIPEIMKKLWGRNALNNLRHWHHVALRIVRLYSCDGDFVKRQEFEDAMRRECWRSEAEHRNPRVNESIIEIGRRAHWGIIIKQNPIQVEQILDSYDI